MLAPLIETETDLGIIDQALRQFHEKKESKNNLLLNQIKKIDTNNGQERKARQNKDERNSGIMMNTYYQLEEALVQGFKHLKAKPTRS